MKETTRQRRQLRDYFGVTWRGFCMGAVDVVPGVSGGTMALLLGIYHEILDAISAVNGRFVRMLFSPRWREALHSLPWKFLLALGAGIGLAIFSLSRGLKWALTHHEVFLWAFFFGLVLASVLVVSRRIQRHGWRTTAGLVLAAAGTYFLVGLAPAETPDTVWFLFLTGMLAVCAMILPGISGAFILVLLGKYEYVLDAVVHMDFLTLLVVASGGLAGLLSLARLLRWLLKNYHDQTIAILAGFMLGSVRKLWPWKLTGMDGLELVNTLPAEFTLEVAAAALLMLAGFAVVLLVENSSPSKSVMPQLAEHK